ncbi:MAG: RIP metalloprotease RseP, partial [Nitrospira sp.]|nr:RIP metalloprotease RseP [Nitrospira sp.]
VIGWIEKDSPAMSGGFQVGDKILKIDKKSVSDWDEAVTILTTHPELGMKVQIERAGEVKELPLEKDPAAKYSGPGYAGLLPEMPAIVGRVNKGYPAEKAGLKTGDRIVEIDGNPVVSWYQVSAYIRSHAGKDMEIEVKRGEQEIKAKVRPVKDQAAGYGVIGIINRQETVTKKFHVMESIEHGMLRSIELTKLTFDVLKRLVSLNLSIESLGGPIMIAKLTGEAAQSGVSDLLAFMAFMSLQLGILNLLPVPVLDGGWVVFLIIEKIKGSPLSKRAMEVAQTVGFAMLITLIVIVSYNDIMRVFK